MQGKVWLLNVWASWCVSCRAEHPVLVEFSKKVDVPVIGLNYKEVRGDGAFDMGKMPADEEESWPSSAPTSGSRSMATRTS
jgi:cytochrome c biogenesis protein CcmG/thiol:disulfide interchange protein DsbE